MKADELLNGIGDVPEKWIKEAGEEYAKKSRRLRILTKVAAAAACLGLVIFAVSRIPWKQKPANAGSTDITAENAGEIKEFISAAVPALSPDALHQLDERQAQQKETEKKVSAYLDHIHANAQEMSLHMNLLPVGNRVCRFDCSAGAFYGSSSQKAEALSSQLEELKGDVFLQRTEEVWYRLKDMPGLKYLILEDANGLSLWQFNSFYTPNSLPQDPDLSYDPANDPFRAAYPEADFSAVSYGELYQTIYGLNGPEDILRITATPPTMIGGSLADDIRAKIGTLTLADTETLAAFYEVIRNAPYNSKAPTSIDSSRFSYSFSTRAKDKDGSGESVWGQRYLCITLKNGITIDSLKYDALAGIFFEHGSVLPSFLSDGQAAVLNRILEIEQDASSLELTEKYQRDLLHNQAASRDGDRLLAYLDSHPDSELSRYFAGFWISDSQQISVLLSCEAPGCLNELESIGFERGAEIMRGSFGSYRETMQLLDELNRGIARINQTVLNGQGTAAEKELMTYFPCTHYDHLTNSISVSVSAPDKESEERAVALFRELVGDHPEVTYKTLAKDEVTAIDY